MLTSTLAFLKPLEKWVTAIHQDDFVTAQRSAEHLLQAAELLVIHPEFRHCFKDHCDGFDPRQALVHMCQLLICATARGTKVLKKNINDGQAEARPRTPRRAAADPR